MSLESVTETLRAAIGSDSKVGKKIKFDLGDDGVVFVDAASSPSTVTNDDGDADATMVMALADLEAMLAGELDGMSAFMQGKLKIEGDMAAAMAFQGAMG